MRRAFIADSAPLADHVRAQLDAYIDVGEATYHWVPDPAERGYWGLVELADGSTITGDRPFRANEIPGSLSESLIATLRRACR